MKPKFLVLEGIDGVGKTTLLKSLVELGFVHFEFASRDTLDLTDARSGYSKILKCLKHFDASRPYVIDRFLLSDVVYNGVLRHEGVKAYKELLKVTLTSEYDFHYVVGKPGQEAKPDYRDSKIQYAREARDLMIKEYETLSNNHSYRIWSRNFKKDSELPNILAQAYGLKGPIDRYYSTDLWKFFVTCMLLEGIDEKSSERAELVIHQLFYKYRSPLSVADASEWPTLLYLLSPLGLPADKLGPLLKISKIFETASVSPGNIWSSRDLKTHLDLSESTIRKYKVFLRV